MPKWLQDRLFQDPTSMPEIQGTVPRLLPLQVRAAGPRDVQLKLEFGVLRGK